VHPEVEQLRAGLEAEGYLADEGLATALYLAVSLQRPLLLEGDAGVGKTEVARVFARLEGRRLIRLQCYEGIDVSQALYEWDYPRQLLLARGSDATPEDLQKTLYRPELLIRRPLLEAIDHGSPVAPVLLIDEIDRADDEFEAFLLEVLSDYAVTVPELGTITAGRPPVAVLTSNRTRDVHDALKRRCVYHWVEHPSFEQEVRIVRLRAGADERLAQEVAAATQFLRGLGLYKPPGVAETIDWARSLAALGCSRLDSQTVRLTLGQVLKYREDQQRVDDEHLEALLRQAAAARG
jgi:MoxR-like ATPase